MRPRSYGPDSADFDWISELGPKAFHPVDYRTMPQSRRPEDHYAWLLRNGMLPSPAHQIKAAREMGVDMAKVDWDAAGRGDGP